MLEQGTHPLIRALDSIDRAADPSRIRRGKWNSDLFIFDVTTVPQAVKSDMDRIDLRQTSSEGTGEPDTHIVENQNYPLKIGDDAKEESLVNFLLNLPVVAIPHASTPDN